MEEDTGKSLHVGGATGRIHGAEYSLLDYNRAGVPLIEIVTKMIPGTRARAPGGGPRLRHRAARPGQGARRLRRADGPGLDALRRQPVARAARLRRAGHPHARRRTSTRCARWSGPCATRCPGRPACSTPASEVIQETRHFQEDTASTRSGRGKETSEDYRYFPEPDLVPIAPSAEWVEELRGTLPELPWARRARLQQEWALSDEELRDWSTPARWTSSRPPSPRARRPATPASGGCAYLAQQANTREVALDELPITPGAGGARDRAGRRRVRSPTSWPARSSTACWPARATPTQVVAARGLAVVSDEGELVAAVDAAMAAQPDVAEKIRGGKVAGRRARSSARS